MIRAHPNMVARRLDYITTAKAHFSNSSGAIRDILIRGVLKHLEESGTPVNDEQLTILKLEVEEEVANLIGGIHLQITQFAAQAFPYEVNQRVGIHITYMPRNFMLHIPVPGAGIYAMTVTVVLKSIR